MTTKNAPSKPALIKAALAQMGKHGWTETALASAAEAEGFSAGVYRAYFPAGLQDFNNAFHEWVDEGMNAALAKQPEFETSKIREKIFRCVMARLKTIQPYRGAAAALLGRQFMPWNAAKGIVGLTHAADAMWKAAGDRSTDYNYYTKRLLLSGVYVATLRVWVKDESAHHADTEAFLRRRIEDVLKVGQTIGGLKDRFKKKAA
jgi:ubiquinone biosynthesis protein COQ9